MIHSITIWTLSRRPNYDLNVDKEYPYSEVPYVGQYHLVKLPKGKDELIDFVDYWGEGRINTPEGSSGFTDCYNVNHHYQLVSNGPDRDRKIPNRIPVISYTKCDTSSYIKDNSVKLVTLMGAPINKSCARDIARMLNFESGKIVVFGFNKNATDIKNLEEELTKKEILNSPNYILPDPLKGLSLFDSHLAYLNLTELGTELYRNVIEGNYDYAIEISRSFDSIKKGGKITDTLKELIKEKDKAKNVMTYAYKLWQSDAKDIIKNNFPSSFTLIFQEDVVKIVNKKFLITLSLNADTGSSKEIKGLGDMKDTNNNKFKIIPEYKDDNIYFKFFNAERNVYLSLDNFHEGKDSQVTGIENVTDAKSEWLLEPVKVNDDVLFLIINRQFNCGLKFADDVNANGEKQLLGSRSPMLDNSEVFGWLVSPFDSTYEYLTKKASERK